MSKPSGNLTQDGQGERLMGRIGFARRNGMLRMSLRNSMVVSIVCVQIIYAFLNIVRWGESGPIGRLRS